MILANTQVHLLSYLPESITGQIRQALINISYKLATEAQALSPTSNNNHPQLWLILIDDAKQLDIFKTRYLAMHEKILFLSADESLYHQVQQTSLKQCRLKNLDCDIVQELLSLEQRVLQNNPQMLSGLDNHLFGDIHFLGRSKALSHVLNRIELIARSNDSVLIEGSTGTGKELTARAIHYLSKRSGQPFIPINCGAFSDDLILSELFGYEKGAFTGAIKAKAGLLEHADGGTLFLDEIDSLSKKAQVALLRYLQDQEVRRIGDHKSIKVNVRVISASNQNIHLLVQKREFREDLMYRLDVLNINLPPLKERAMDMLLLGQFFLARLAMEHNNKVKVLSQHTINSMTAYPWPGNIRELENFIKRAYLLCDQDLICQTCVNPNLEPLQQCCGAEFNDKEPDSFQNEKQLLVAKFEKDYMHRILQKTRGNVSKAAELANKERRSFCRLMKKHGLNRDRYTGMKNMHD